MNTVKVVTDLKGMAKELTNLDKKVEAMYADACNGAMIFSHRITKHAMWNALGHGLAIGACIALVKHVIELEVAHEELKDRVEKLELESGTEMEE